MAESVGLDTLTAPGAMLVRARGLKQRVRAGEVVLGAWLSLTDPVAAEILGRVGFDYLMIDAEHSVWDHGAMQTAILALNGSPTVPIVRVAWNDHVRIKQALDLGAEGIVAPMVRTTDECRALVSACLYPPLGTRGYGPRRASNYYRDADAYVAAANDSILIMPQLEDVTTLDALDAYLSVPGIDALWLGPNDLSGSAGLLRRLDHPTVRSALDKAIEAAAARGISVCMGVNSVASEQAALVARGVRMLLVTSDTELLIAGSIASLRATREALR
jgi:2-keto-3-deoxy-L-rhamnonate aldolase RhmA